MARPEQRRGDASATASPPTTWRASEPGSPTWADLGELGQVPPRPQIPARFDVLQHVNSGGMGSVWKVRDQESGEVVALKVPLQADGRGSARLREEFRAAQLVVHPSLVSLQELFADCTCQPSSITFSAAFPFVERPRKLVDQRRVSSTFQPRPEPRRPSWQG